MGRSYTIFLRTVFVVLWLVIVVFLCLAIPYQGLLKVFLVMIGSMILAWVGMLLVREASKLIDLRHWQSTRRELRELELRKRKREHLLPVTRRKRW